MITAKQTYQIEHCDVTQGIYTNFDFPQTVDNNETNANENFS